MGKIKTNAEKESLIQEFLSSGKSKIIWCKEKGIPYATFYKWCKRYELNQETSQTKFIALSETSPAKKAEPEALSKVNKQELSLVVVEVNDCKISISNTFDFDLLTNVIKAVKLANV